MAGGPGRHAPAGRGAPLGFPLAFALALVLFYWGRPVGWVLAYLEVVLLVALWPALGRWQRPALLGAALALMASRWWALALTLQGQGLLLLTLQPAHPAWETWLVLPASWLLLLWAVPPPLPGRDAGRGAGAGALAALPGGAAT